MWDAFAPKSRKVNLIKCLTLRTLKICSDNRIKSEFEQIKIYFGVTGILRKLLLTPLKTVDKFRNNIRPFGLPKYPLYVRLPWIGSSSQLVADKVSFSVTRCFNASMVRTIFAFHSALKDVLPIFQQSNLIYKFQCCCNATYIGRTSQRLEVKVRQHVSRDIHNRTTSGHSKLLDSAICEHLNAINSCVVNYNKECFGVLHRARTKQHLVFLDALYILLYKPTLCKQNPKDSLNLLGDNYCLTQGGFNYFSPWSWYHSHFYTHPFNQFNVLTLSQTTSADQMKAPLQFQYFFSIYSCLPNCIYL